MNLTDFFVANTIGGTMALCVYMGLELLNDPENFSSNLRNTCNDIAWWAVDRTALVVGLVKQQYRQCSMDLMRIQQEKEGNNNYFIFDMKTGEIDEQSTLENEFFNEENHQVAYKRAVQDGKYYYKQISDVSDDIDFDGNETIKKCNPFMSCNLTINSETYDLYETVKSFSIEDNLFTHETWCFIMTTKFDVDIRDAEYEVSILDSNVQSITICYPEDYETNEDVYCIRNGAFSRPSNDGININNDNDEVSEPSCDENESENDEASEPSDDDKNENE